MREADSTREGVLHETLQSPRMNTTKEWAEYLKIPSGDDLPAIPGFSEPYVRSAQDVAVRSVILQGVVAVAWEVEAEPVIEWFQKQGIWDAVTPNERAFLEAPERDDALLNQFHWKQETEWTLLWMIQRVETLGLPTRYCDTRRLVNEIIPALGDDLRSFISESTLRSPGALLAEDDRTYDLWCHALASRQRREHLPSDLNVGILRERRYAFEWLSGSVEWDAVTCDA